VTLSIPSHLNIAEHFLLEPARRHPERVAIVEEPAAINYGELAALASQVAGALARSGCLPGDRVLVVLPDSAEFIAAFFGAAWIGAVAVPVNPMTRAADYAYFLKDSGARLAIVHSAAWGEFARAVQSESTIGCVLVGDYGVASGQALRWKDWLPPATSAPAVHPTCATDTAFILYTSGSSGTAKGAVHQHKSMLACARGVAQDILKMTAGDRCLSVSKLFFAYGLGNGMYFPLSAGAATILNPERPRPERVLELVSRHRPTLFFAVPTFYAALLAAVEAGLSADFSSVRLAVSAGEALPPELFERFRRRFGIEILDGIGSTEMLHMFIMARPGRTRPGSCGQPVAGYEARILNDEGQLTMPDQIGMLHVRGPSAFAGYWNKPEQTAKARAGDWVITGDKFTLDPDGFFHYRGRADDMMKVAGMWVSPGEVESALLGHPSVLEAAVVARLADGLAQPEAYVVLREGHTVSDGLAEEIRSSVRSRLPSHKVPRAVHFVGELPKTATGKIQRFRLREGQG
jgi:benzoate-CoA ligase family protein